MRPASASPYSGFSNLHTTGTPRSSKNRSPGGSRTCTSPSSPSNCPWRYSASTSNCLTLRLEMHPTAPSNLNEADRAAGASVSSVCSTPELSALLFC
eukprot:5678941-Pleurochrysis_carterae.AAC.1